MLFNSIFPGFSRTTVDLLNQHEADYSSFDILTDEEVRQGLKTYSNWPTYPQVCPLLMLYSSQSLIQKTWNQILQISEFFWILEWNIFSVNG